MLAGLKRLTRLIWMFCSRLLDILVYVTYRPAFEWICFKQLLHHVRCNWCLFQALFNHYCNLCCHETADHARLVLQSQYTLQLTFASNSRQSTPLRVAPFLKCCCCWCSYRRTKLLLFVNFTDFHVVWRPKSNHRRLYLFGVLYQLSSHVKRVQRYYSKKAVKSKVRMRNHFFSLVACQCHISLPNET
jgi:hypothetical protein